MIQFSLSKLRGATLAACLISAPMAYAHHGVNGQFDMSKSIEITGVITKIKLVNPHSYVYFDIQNADGKKESWRCELGSGSALRRAGWKSRTFAKGKEITIVGAPGRNGKLECHANKIVFDDGMVLTRSSVLDDDGKVLVHARQTMLDDGVLNLDGSWVADRPKRPGPPPGKRPDGAKLANGQPPEGMGKRGRPPEGTPPPEDGRRPSITLTAAGEQAIADYTMEDMPRLHCEPTSILDDWTFDQLVNEIHQTEDDITIQYGFMSITRTIHLDLDKHPENITPSIAGHSIGKWEDGALVVDTIGFTPGFARVTPNKGGTIPNSDQLHIVERFTLSEDGLTLHREYEIEDPLYLEGKVTGEDDVKFTESGYLPYNCDDLTNPDHEITAGSE